MIEELDEASYCPKHGYFSHLFCNVIKVGQFKYVYICPECHRLDTTDKVKLFWQINIIAEDVLELTLN